MLPPWSLLHSHSQKKGLKTHSVRLPTIIATTRAGGPNRVSHRTPAFGRLGPLTARFPHAATVRFHLGELLLWTRQVAKARNELRIAVKMAPRSQIGQVAKLFLDRLPRAGTS